MGGQQHRDTSHSGRRLPRRDRYRTYHIFNVYVRQWGKSTQKVNWVCLFTIGERNCIWQQVMQDADFQRPKHVHQPTETMPPLQHVKTLRNKDNRRNDWRVQNPFKIGHHAYGKRGKSRQETYAVVDASINENPTWKYLRLAWLCYREKRRRDFHHIEYRLCSKRVDWRGDRD